MTKTNGLVLHRLLEDLLAVGTRDRLDNDLVAEQIERLDVPNGQSLFVHGGGYEQRLVATA